MGYLHKLLWHTCPKENYPSNGKLAYGPDHYESRKMHFNPAPGNRISESPCRDWETDFSPLKLKQYI